MVFDANIDAKGDRTDHSIHHTEVSLVSLHNKLRSPEEQTLRHAEGGEAKYKQPQRPHGQGTRLGRPPTP
jgi:hypothetical protein